MCGILYINKIDGSKTINKKIIKRYKAQKHRGSEGFGFYIPNLDRLAHNTSESRMLKLVKRNPASEMLFHHRWPTSTPNVRNSCHPFVTKCFKKQYILVHNGVIWNDDELFAAHAERGIEYVSSMAGKGKRIDFNDSEALLYDVALYLEGEQDELKAEGDIAFILIEKNEKGAPSKLHFARNSSPLKMQFLEGKHLILTSEGEGEQIKADTLYTYDYATGKLSENYLEIPSGYTQTWGTGSMGFDHFGETGILKDGTDMTWLTGNLSSSEDIAKAAAEYTAGLYYQGLSDESALEVAFSDHSSIEKQLQIFAADYREEKDPFILADVAAEMSDCRKELKVIAEAIEQIHDIIDYKNDAATIREMEKAAEKESEIKLLKAVNKPKKKAKVKA